MKRLILTSILLLNLTAYGLELSTLEAAEDTVSKPEQAEAPVYKGGGSWTYRVSNKLYSGSRSDLLADGDYEVTFQEGKRRIFQLDSGQNSDASNPGALTLMLPIKGIIEADTQYFQFPLAVGKKWTAKYYSKPASRWITADNSVTGIETVTTPAGTFQAFKIERQVSMAVGTVYRGTTHTQWTYTYFYSPQTRSILKYHYQSESAAGGGGNLTPVQTTDIELIKFDATSPK
jgi:hypothetical protein